MLDHFLSCIISYSQYMYSIYTACNIHILDNKYCIIWLKSPSTFRNHPYWSPPSTRSTLNQRRKKSAKKKYQIQDYDFSKMPHFGHDFFLGFTLPEAKTAFENSSHPQKTFQFPSMNCKVRSIPFRFREGTVFNFGKSVGRSWKNPTGDFLHSP